MHPFVGTGNLRPDWDRRENQRPESTLPKFLGTLRLSSAGVVVTTKNITAMESRGPEEWFVMRLRILQDDCEK